MQHQLVFDTAKFQQMTPPFHVRVERMEGNLAQVVPLPIKENETAPGPGWSSDDVLNLEQGILASFGGGTYRFQITDSSNEEMRWSQMFPVTTYPKRPLMPDAMPPGGMQAMQPPPQPQPGYQGMPINWQAQQQMYPPGYPQYPQYPQYSPPPGFAPPAYGYAPPPSYRPGPVDETTRLRQEAEAARLSAMEERHKAELQRQADESRRAVDELRRLTEQNKPNAAMEERLAREREERHKAEREAERARHEAELKAIEARLDKSGTSDADLRMQRLEDDQRRREDQQRQEAALREIREENRRREDMLMAQLNELKANRGPDPMMTFLLQQMQTQSQAQAEAARIQAETAKETARIQAEADKERARLLADAAKERSREQEVLLASLKPFMMPPVEMARMMSDKDSSQHQFVRSMATTFNDVAGVMRDWFSNMAQMVGGNNSESPVVRVIEGGIESAKEMFKNYNDGKAQVAAAQANAQREYIRAQAQQHQQQPQPQPGWQPPPPVAQQQPGNGLNGANGAPQPAPANGNGAVQPIPTAPAVSPLRKGGKTDEEWLGVALPDILKLREGVGVYLASIAVDPPRLGPDKKPLGISPDQVAQAILTASQIIETQKIPGVLAFEYLYKQEMYNDLIEVLLPDAPGPFRNDAVKHLYRMLGQGPAPDPTPAHPPINGTGAVEEENPDKDDDHDGRSGGAIAVRS